MKSKMVMEKRKCSGMVFEFPKNRNIVKDNSNAKIPKEKYGKVWSHAYRPVPGKRGIQPVLVKKSKGQEQIIIPSKAYITRHHPQGPWDS
jgi:hypothetical protein